MFFEVHIFLGLKTFLNSFVSLIGMGYLDQNANFGLLVLVAVIALALVGVTLFFQDKFSDVNDEYDAKVQSLEEATGNLVEMQQDLSQINEELGVKEQREETLATNYASVTDENEALNEQNAKLKKEVNDLKDDVKERDSTIDSLEGDIRDKDREIERLENKKEEWRQLYLSCS